MITELHREGTEDFEDTCGVRGEDVKHPPLCASLCLLCVSLCLSFLSLRTPGPQPAEDGVEADGDEEERHDAEPDGREEGADGRGAEDGDGDG